jgi:hypothetical protein
MINAVRFGGSTVIDTPPEYPPLPQKPVAEALIDCGLLKDGFKVTYEKDLQGNVVAISVRAGANRENLQCIWDAAWTEFVQFEDNKLQVAYDEITESRFAPIVQQQARDALAKRGLLDGLPERSKFSSLEEFAVAIEQHCGFDPKQALHIDNDLIVFNPEVRLSSSFDLDKSECIFGALFASGQTKIGFIGNELSDGH